MKVVLQRVKQAQVTVEGDVVGKIGRGICLLVGIEQGDEEAAAAYIARKVLELRIFPDKAGRMNLSLLDIGGEVLAVSQFTLAASVRRGRRPSFDRAEEPERAAGLFERFVAILREEGVRVATGVFGAMMDVALTNDGPVTFIIHSPQKE